MDVPRVEEAGRVASIQLVRYANSNPPLCIFFAYRRQRRTCIHVRPSLQYLLSGRMSRGPTAMYSRTYTFGPCSLGWCYQFSMAPRLLSIARVGRRGSVKLSAQSLEVIVHIYERMGMLKQLPYVYPTCDQIRLLIDLHEQASNPAAALRH